MHRAFDRAGSPDGSRIAPPAKLPAARGVWSLSFGDNLRATFSYGTEHQGDAHIIWRRIGGHDIYREP